MMLNSVSFARFSTAFRRKGTLVVCLFMFNLALIPYVSAGGSQITKFDPPNAGAGPDQGTTSTGINVLGTITGDVTDSNNGTHGFVRTPWGEFKEFDVPGADPVVGCTCPNSINDFGAVAGQSIDTNGVSHGFLRSLDGKINVFDVAEAGIGSGQGTLPFSNNDFGVIAGYYVDANDVAHGFVRIPDGKITTFDPSGSQGTFPNNVNNLGVVAGTYYDTDFVLHGFLRAFDGKITTFEVPGAVIDATSIGTSSAYVNDLGVVGGSYFDATTFVQYGYVRTPNGRFTKFAAPGAGTVEVAGTNVLAISLQGAITGFVTNNNFDALAFVRTPDGKTTSFGVPGQIEGAGNSYGSAGWAINAEGVVAGRWRDPNYALHGFIRKP
jgi:hypothetical protein